MRTCNHQSLRLVGVDGIKPAGTQWYECRCGQRLLVHIIASSPQDKEIAEAKALGIPVERLFLARDTTSWGLVEQAKARNVMLDELEEIGLFLKKRTPELEEGMGYIQQDQRQIDEVRARLLKLVARSYKKEILPATTLHDLMTDVVSELELSDEDPVWSLYMRLACMDCEAREWQTPDLAKHPETGKQVELQSSNAGRDDQSIEERAQSYVDRP